MLPLMLLLVSADPVDERYVVAESVALRDFVPGTAQERQGDPSRVVLRLHVNDRVRVLSDAQRPWIQVETDDPRWPDLLRMTSSRDALIGLLIHERYLSRSPADFDETLRAAQAAMEAGAPKRAMQLATRAAAIRREVRAYRTMEAAFEAMGDAAAASRVAESASDQIEYVAICAEGEIVLAAELRKDGRLLALPRTAHLPTWHQVLLRRDASARRWIPADGRDVALRGTLRWRREASSYERVSHGVLALSQNCTSGAVYATAPLVSLTASSVSIEPIDARLDELRTLGESHAATTSAKVIGARSRTVEGLSIVETRLVFGGARKRVYGHRDGPYETWHLQGATGDVDVAVTEQGHENRWFRLDRGPAFTLGLQPDGGMWTPGLIKLVTVDGEDAIEVQTIELVTGGC